MRGKLFTPGEDKAIRWAYRHRQPLREVAAELGRTKNMVIGRAKRLGLQRPGGNLDVPHNGQNHR